MSEDTSAKKNYNPGMIDFPSHAGPLLSIMALMGRGEVGFSIGTWGTEDKAVGILVIVPAKEPVPPPFERQMPISNIDTDGVGIVVAFDTVRDVQRMIRTLEKLVDIFPVPDEAAETTETGDTEAEEG